MLQCDYLSFTFKPERLPYLERERITKRLESRHSDDEGFWRLTDFEFFVEVFPEIASHLDSFVLVESARMYKRRHCFNDSCYIYDDDGFGGNKGVNVEFPSHGLHLIKEWFKLENDSDVLFSFGNILLRRGCSLSRLDVCADIPINKCPVMPKDFLYWASTGQIKSHYRVLQGVGRCTDDFIIKTLCDGNGGATFYLGSRRHQMFRCYDKSIESNGENNSIRFEIESHRDKAMLILSNYLEHRFDFTTVLLSMLDVLAYSSDTENRCRIRRDSKFSELISCLTKNEEVILIPAKKKPVTLVSRMAWAHRIYSSIVELEYISPEFRRALEDLKRKYTPSAYAENMRTYLQEFDDYHGKEVFE